MKTDLSIYEIKHLLKKFEKQNRVKTIMIIGIGVAVFVAAIIYIILKAKKKDCPLSYDGLDMEDFDELDDLDYDDYDFDDYDDAEYEDADFGDEEEAEEE